MTFLIVAVYVASLAGVYALFVRCRTRQKQRGPSKWFDSDEVRETYKRMYQEMPDELGAEELKQLKAALLRRAVVNVQRIFVIRDDRPALLQLLSKGVVGDALWQDFLAAESDLDAEISECVREAEELQQGWGKMLLSQAAQIYHRERERENEQYRKLVASVVEKETPSMQRNREILEQELLQEELKGKLANNSQKRK